MLHHVHHLWASLFGVVSRAVQVPALNTLALVCAWYIPLIALAVLLLAVALSTLAALEVLSSILVHLVLESLDVPLQDVSDCLLPLMRMLVVVVAH